MSTKYEAYESGDDNHGNVYGTTWKGQVFTPTTSHTITSVKLLLYGEGSPGTLTVSIRNTSGEAPTGGDLCSGTTNGNTLPTGSPYEWREIALGAGTKLIAGVQYAIVWSCTGLDTSNDVHIRADFTSPGYSGGLFQYSSDSGVTWASFTGRVGLFSEWGDPLPSRGWWSK